MFVFARAGVGRGRPGGDAGPGGQPRARQRARAHVLGGLLDRHESRRRRGGHHHRGHAAVRDFLPPHPMIGGCIYIEVVYQVLLSKATYNKYICQKKEKQQYITVGTVRMTTYNIQ